MSGKRWLLVVAILAVLVSSAAGFGLLVALPRYVEGKVLETAEARGLTLEPEKISFGWGWVQITQSRATLDRVRSVQIQVGRIDVALDGFAPTSIELENVDGLVTGSLTNVGLELSEWTKNHPDAYALPLSAKNVRVRFVEPAGTPPWLDVTGGQLTRTAQGGVFAAPSAKLLGVDLGKVGAGFAREASTIALGFGEADLGKAPLRVEVNVSGKEPSARFSLAPTPAEKLVQPLGIPVPIAGVVVSSETHVSLGTLISGDTQITLKGYIPPHPFELDGFIFGDTTTFDTKFALNATRDRMTLTDAHLAAGKFELRGDGLLVRSSDHSEAALKLKGDLPCSALAGVEAESRLYKILGGNLSAKAGKLAEKLVNGSVAIGLELRADTRNLAAAGIKRTIGMGCGLRPLSLAELAKLVPLPADLNELLKDLPALPTDLGQLPALPAGMPSGLPPLPKGLPTIPTDLPKLPDLTLPPLPTAKPSSKPVAPAAPAGSAG